MEKSFVSKENVQKTRENLNIKKNTAFLKKINSDIAQEISAALQKLTAENIKVEFDSIQAFEEREMLIDIGEKCYGCSLNFKVSNENLQGRALGIFPLSSANALIELSLKPHFNKNCKDNELRLSAFKEAVNILLMTYISGFANALKAKVMMSVPKFVSFQKIDYTNFSLSGRHSKLELSASVGQFKITGANNQLLRGALLLFFKG